MARRKKTTKRVTVSAAALRRLEKAEQAERKAWAALKTSKKTVRKSKKKAKKKTAKRRRRRRATR